MVKNSQTIENKWEHGADERSSDEMAEAPVSDHNNADWKDNPYATKPAPKKPGQNLNPQATQKLKTLVNNCIDAAGLLLTDSKYQNSVGIKAITSNLPLLLDMLNNMNGLDVEAVNNLLGSLNFYTNPSNKGTGFDPATQVKNPPMLSPADYLKQIMAITATLKN